MAEEGGICGSWLGYLIMSFDRKTEREKLENFVKSETKDWGRIVKTIFTMTRFIPPGGAFRYIVSATLTGENGKEMEVNATFDTRDKANYCMSRHEHSAENSFGLSLVSRENRENQPPDSGKEWMIETSTWS